MVGGRERKNTERITEKSSERSERDDKKEKPFLSTYAFKVWKNCHEELKQK